MWLAFTQGSFRRYALSENNRWAVAGTSSMFGAMPWGALGLNPKSRFLYFGGTNLVRQSMTMSEVRLPAVTVMGGPCTETKSPGEGW